MRILDTNFSMDPKESPIPCQEVFLTGDVIHYIEISMGRLLTMVLYMRGINFVKLR